MPAIKRKFQGSSERRFIASSYVRSGATLPYFLSEYLESAEIFEPQAGRRLERAVILQQRHSHHEVGEVLTACRVGDRGDISGQALRIEEARNRRPLFGFLVDHQRSTDAAVRVAAAGERAPLRIWTVHQVRKAREGADEGNR